jgi:hypothetical protein
MAVCLSVVALVLLGLSLTLGVRSVSASGSGNAAETYQGKTAYWWAHRAVQARKDANARGRTIRRLKTELRNRHQFSSVRAIGLASVAYHVSFSTLYRKASCETGGTLSPYARNRSSSASGLFQFLTSTWASTPYARYSIWDPYANSLAAAWMHAHGRGGEWSCR